MIAVICDVCGCQGPAADTPEQAADLAEEQSFMVGQYIACCPTCLETGREQRYSRPVPAQIRGPFNLDECDAWAAVAR